MPSYLLTFLQQRGSSEETDMWIQKMKYKQGTYNSKSLRSLIHFSSHIRSPSFAGSGLIITNLRTFLSLSYSFPLVARWWLFNSCRCSLPLRKIQNVRTHCQNCRISMTLKRAGHLASRTEFFF